MKKARISAALLVVALFLPAVEVNATGHCEMECNLQNFNFCIFTGNERIKCWNITGGCVSGASDTCEGGSPIEPVDPV